MWCLLHHGNPTSPSPTTRKRSVTGTKDLAIQMRSVEGTLRGFRRLKGSRHSGGVAPGSRGSRPRDVDISCDHAITCLAKDALGKGSSTACSALQDVLLVKLNRVLAIPAKCLGCLMVRSSKHQEVAADDVKCWEPSCCIKNWPLPLLSKTSLQHGRIKNSSQPAHWVWRCWPRRLQHSHELCPLVVSQSRGSIASET